MRVRVTEIAGTPAQLKALPGLVRALRRSVRGPGVPLRGIGAVPGRTGRGGPGARQRRRPPEC